MEGHTTSIEYDTGEKKYAMTLDGELVGYAWTYGDAETTLNELIASVDAHQNA